MKPPPHFFTEMLSPYSIKTSEATWYTFMAVSGFFESLIQETIDELTAPMLCENGDHPWHGVLNYHGKSLQVGTPPNWRTPTPSLASWKLGGACTPTSSFRQTSLILMPHVLCISAFQSARQCSGVYRWPRIHPLIVVVPLLFIAGINSILDPLVRCNFLDVVFSVSSVAGRQQQ